MCTDSKSKTTGITSKLKKVIAAEVTKVETQQGNNATCRVGKVI